MQKYVSRMNGELNANSKGCNYKNREGMIRKGNISRKISLNSRVKLKIIKQKALSYGSF